MAQCGRKVIFLILMTATLGGCQYKRNPDDRPIPTFHELHSQEVSPVSGEKSLTQENDPQLRPVVTSSPKECFNYTQTVRRILEGQRHLLVQTSDIRVVDPGSEDLSRYREIDHLSVHLHEPSREYMAEALMRYFAFHTLDEERIAKLDVSVSQDGCEKIEFQSEIENPAHVPVFIPFKILSSLKDSIRVERTWPQGYRPNGLSHEISDQYMDLKQDPDFARGMVWTRYHYFRSGRCTSSEEAHVLAVTTVVRGYDSELPPYPSVSEEFVRRIMGVKDVPLKCEGDKFDSSEALNSFVETLRKP